MASMDWRDLLSNQRLRGGPPTQALEGDSRSDFLRDHDRLIFSSALRRMQDKTQVFPLAKSDYVRTRLTHSLEVASVGRSMGSETAAGLLRAERSLKGIVDPTEVSTIVAAACLAHDIGNPPFGHAGESAIQEWFTESPEGIACLKKWRLPQQQQADLENFEGNAQGFRTVARLQYAGQDGGLRLTCATLAACAKYPCTSLHRKGNGVSAKKFNFFHEDANLFEEVADTVGLLPKRGKSKAWHRHPLAFLVEAADDVCYHLIDVEDGLRVGRVGYDEVRALYGALLDDHDIQRADAMEQVRQRAEFLRTKAIGKLIHEVSDAFVLERDGLLTGSFDQPLADVIPSAGQLKAFKKLARAKVYNAPQVLEIEACGFDVLGGLLGAFVGAVEDAARRGDEKSARSRTLLQLMPRSSAAAELNDPYLRCLRVTDFVAGMTDSYAVQLYQRIRGISLP